MGRDHLLDKLFDISRHAAEPARLTAFLQEVERVRFGPAEHLVSELAKAPDVGYMIMRL